MISFPSRNRGEFVYKDLGKEESWYQKKYYYGGENLRYHTFHAALNILFQECESPLIVETGCQRQEGDVSAGMSTSIFGEYVKRYGGRLITVDVNGDNLRACRQITEQYADNISYVQSDSVQFLQNFYESPDLVYFDSYNYDVHGDVLDQRRSQEHCLAELMAIESRLLDTSLLLFDDNDFAGGGKPYMAKRHLVDRRWTCFLDFQQTLWMKRR